MLHQLQWGREEGGGGGWGGRTEARKGICAILEFPKRVDGDNLTITAIDIEFNNLDIDTWLKILSDAKGVPDR
jgi:hypothetical protein